MEPNVYVQTTVGFTRAQYTFLELIEQGADHVEPLGIYEYLNVWAWWRDMPSRLRGADLTYLEERTPYYIEQGATTIPGPLVLPFEWVRQCTCHTNLFLGDSLVEAAYLPSIKVVYRNPDAQH